MQGNKKRENRFACIMPAKALKMFSFLKRSDGNYHVMEIILILLFLREKSTIMIE
jgi:hypothetical protein